MGAPWCIVCECSLETDGALRANRRESRLQGLSESLTPCHYSILTLVLNLYVCMCVKNRHAHRTAHV